MDKTAMDPIGQPKWWTDEHTSGWDRVKAAMRRDWEQTKHDFSAKHGQQLHQNVDDTVKQAVGKQAIPPAGEPERTGKPREDRWESVEPAMRYGYGAGSYHKDEPAWNDRVESKLRTEWGDMKSGRTWDEVRGHVRHGWDKVRGEVK